MSGLICVKKQSKLKVNGDQKSFQQLKRKIEFLKEKEKTQQTSLEEALAFYYNNIRPNEEKLNQLMEKRLQLFYQIYKTKQSFSKQERKLLKELLLENLDEIYSFGGLKGLSASLEGIAKELGWNSPEEALSEEFQEMLGGIQEMFSEQGVQVDVSGINMQDGEQEILRKLFASVQMGMNTNEEAVFQKRNIKKQPKNRQIIEEMQKKSINTIYKQLAKVLHPDLEQDLDKKLEKEKLMKKLTVAYENKDLYVLLDLEMEWIHSSSGNAKIESQEQLKIYNKMLKEQATVLQGRIKALFLHPKYFPIQSFYADAFTGMNPLLTAYRELQDNVQDVSYLVEQLQTPQVEQLMHQVLQQERMLRQMKENFFS